MPHKIVRCQGKVVNSIETLYILLKRLSYLCRLSDMLPLFRRNPTEICLIFNYVVDYILNRFNHHLSSRNQNILQPNNLALYCNVHSSEGNPTAKLIWVFNGSVLRISRPNINQNIVYNGHKRVHGIKFGFT